MSQFHLDLATYPSLIREDVARYAELRGDGAARARPSSGRPPRQVFRRPPFWTAGDLAIITAVKVEGG
jgi:hypothetical protein